MKMSSIMWFIVLFIGSSSVWAIEPSDAELSALSAYNDCTHTETKCMYAKYQTGQMMADCQDEWKCTAKHESVLAKSQSPSITQHYETLLEKRMQWHLIPMLYKAGQPHNSDDLSVYQKLKAYQRCVQEHAECRQNNDKECAGLRCVADPVLIRSKDPIVSSLVKIWSDREKRWIEWSMLAF